MRLDRARGLHGIIIIMRTILLLLLLLNITHTSLGAKKTKTVKKTKTATKMKYN